MVQNLCHLFVFRNLFWAVWAVCCYSIDNGKWPPVIFNPEIHPCLQCFQNSCLRRFLQGCVYNFIPWVLCKQPGTGRMLLENICLDCNHLLSLGHSGTRNGKQEKQIKVGTHACTDAWELGGSRAARLWVRAFVLLPWTTTDCLSSCCFRTGGDPNQSGTDLHLQPRTA